MRLLAIAVPLLASTGSAIAQEAPAKAPVFITLGTMGGPIADSQRSQPANVLLNGADAYLIDVGDGAVEQLAKAGVPLRQVKAVFLSHLHFDHTGGLAAVLGLRYQTTLPGKLAIYGPPGTRALVDGLVASMKPAAEAGYGLPGAPVVDPATLVEVTELGDGASVTLGTMKVTAAQNSHYSFAAGSDLDRKYKSLAFRFDLPGRSIAYTGDTGPSVAVERLAKGADLLVSEMIDVDATVANVRRNSPGIDPAAIDGVVRHLAAHHLTATQVGELAAAAGVKQVIVTHFVAPGVTDAGLKAIEATITAKSHGPVTMATDLQRF